MFALLAIVIVLLLIILLDTTRQHHAAKFARTIATIRPCYPLLGIASVFLGKSELQRFENFVKVLQTVDRIGKAWLGPQLIFYVSHPDLIQQVLTDPNCCEKPFFYEFVKLKHGLFSAKYSLWRPYRKALNPTFNAKILNSFVPIFERFSRKLVQNLKSRPEGTAVDMLEFTTECALEMVCGTTLGTGLKNGSGKREFMRSMQVLMSKVATRVLSVSIYNESIYCLTKGHKEENRARQNCLDFALRIIKDRRGVLGTKAESMDSDDGYQVRRPKLFIDQVLSGTHSETNFDEQNLSEQVLTIMGAGYDTSAHMVAHTCLFLAMFPELQEKLALEIESKLPDHEQELTVDSLKDLPFLDKFYKESMRLAPVGSTVARENLTEIELDGCRIPRGNIFLLNYFILHRRKDVWGPDADQFDPENFAPERSSGRHPFAYLPFSGGSRNCIGARYAVISNKIMIIHIVRNFRLSTEIKFADLKYRLEVTLHLAFKHLITLKARK
ncbi:cytochrome P450 4c21-like [Ochlerotatus camptorhynchus]|uniref:cytochrome P450 4c21-like n=1 Tax=Ochlerotatus camptorhynchus TaxID=644619 RepID=UPI0031DF43F6